MLVDPVSLSAKNVMSSVQAKPEEAAVCVSLSNLSKGSQPDFSRMERLAEDIQDNLKIIHNVDLRFSVHRSSGQIMITVLNETTGEIIREIPSSEMLNLAAKIEEMIGLIFDQTM